MKNVEEILEEMTKIYSEKAGHNQSFLFQLTETTQNKSWYISSKTGQTARLTKTSAEDPQIVFTFTKNTLFDIYSGKMTGFTAIGRENISDKTPLDFELAPGAQMTEAFMDKMYGFIQQFFNPTIPETITLDKSHSRQVHGAHAIPMFYHTGFRSGWYQIDKGEKLNNEGDINPFSQAFVIIQGHGYAKIREITQEVGAGKAYFIPPDSDHVLWNEEETPLQLIYLAWGEKA